MLEIAPRVLVEQEAASVPVEPDVPPGVSLSPCKCVFVLRSAASKVDYLTYLCDFGETSMQFIAYDNQSINRLNFYNFGTTYWNSGLSSGCPVKGNGGDEASMNAGRATEETSRRWEWERNIRGTKQAKYTSHTRLLKSTTPLQRGTEIRSTRSCQAPTATSCARRAVLHTHASGSAGSRSVRHHVSHRVLSRSNGAARKRSTRRSLHARISGFPYGLLSFLCPCDEDDP
jgi:hypothetical protein